jgi:iron complex transport system substrate-binding protein
VLVGRALGREAQAKKVVADVQAKFERVRSEHPEFEGKSAILAYGGPDGYGAYATQDTRSRFLSDLGFKTSKEIDELAGESFFTKFSPGEIWAPEGVRWPAEPGFVCADHHRSQATC